jgi:predicted Fe-S protein YdhL (DUF1289 family)
MDGDDLFEFVEPARVLSPCINICRLDTRTGWCVGCGRTGNEIAAWSTAGDAGRQAILDSLPARMATLREP